MLIFFLLVLDGRIDAYSNIYDSRDCVNDRPDFFVAQIDWTDGVEQQGDYREEDYSKVDFVILGIASDCNQATADEYDDPQERIVSDRKVCDSKEEESCGDKEYPDHSRVY